MSEDRWLVVGLGNPGPQYAGNRHNVGQMVLDELAQRGGTSFATGGGGLMSRGPRAATAQVRLGGLPGIRVVLAKPGTFMNTSGGPVSALARYYDIPPERVVLVHDDMDIPFGMVRLKLGGGEGGHNGLRDTTKALGTKDYLRVRVGVGRPPGRQDPADFVLRDFGGSERQELPLVLDSAADAVESVIIEGLAKAQLRFHTKGS